MKGMGYFLKGILIGLLFGLPVGAVGAMTIECTWNKGMKAGLFTGLGSSIADCLYASVGVFGLTLISDFLLKYQVMINILGGCLVLFMGIRLLMKKDGAFLLHCRHYQSRRNPYVPVCLFLFWDFRQCGSSARRFTGVWRVCRDILLVGNAYCRYQSD